MLRARTVGRDVRKIDLGLLARGKLDLRFLRRILQALQGKNVVLQVDPGLLLELLDDVVDQALIEILPAEEGVAIRRQDFELVLAVDFSNLDDRDVEGPTAQVVDRDLLVTLLLVHAEGQGRCRRFVDDAFDFQTGDPPGILGRLALAIVEIGRHGDHRLGDLLAQVILGGLLHLAQHFGGNLRRGNLLAAHLDPGVTIVRPENLERHQGDILLHFLLFKAATNQPLDRVQGVFRIGHGLTLGRRSAENFTIFRISDR
ncbi:MAG: NAD-specific glutamate dehydrogenase [Candidatus Accumulibacter phosphatis]|uniref:NAD-specific glutamate dehydrogenase n=1 Tax=Candidatus Accumulibacter phosphatis TaxID=327160 RepID=A0A080M9K9_9PROT|nr:MAG: NAD-specific glutamate dehydrogenase [Candidatus Accumulibacter phosphatis]